MGVNKDLRTRGFKQLAAWWLNNSLLCVSYYYVIKSIISCSILFHLQVDYKYGVESIIIHIV